MRLSRWHLGALVLLAAMIVVGAFLVVGDQPSPQPSPEPAPGPAAPRVVVAMGDSTVSGEGAGDYETGTNGERGNWCHRSRKALVHNIKLPGVERTINLACSGAASAQVGLGDAIQYTEPSQAGRLAEIARTERVVAVVIAVGANDDPAFAHSLDACVRARFGGTPCSQKLSEDWQRKVDAMVPKATRAVRDVNRVLTDAGYGPDDYQLVLQSYAAPIAPNMVSELQNLSGCPFKTEDLRWVRDVAVPTLTAGLRKVADQTDARFLDLSSAGTGHEACTNRTEPTREWFRRLAVSWQDLNDDQRAGHALQESFHPNALMHAEIGRCLSEFLATSERRAACLLGGDGQLHAAPS
ncbi:GDSL-like lipase/acylhydrolase family protein [Herbihabitans rhizosphaerae]|uniref:GDSL-like lipase/acylhydrolase family protein n=1 Tax=Herbihabitans rhizosphaerae TaxID=1872711 RepID=A0A4Q7L3J5_9PSEU|nr:GDSL-type esterase/lipase family protein [Herbihabitans rhizosphaerae]RZS43754.1 GDSL-like lipase/acylhydrolase family protein [Herbihabitans rhizosphaerae]